MSALAEVIFLPWLRPAAIWWAVVALAVGVELAAELFNMEHVIDQLHPEPADPIRVAKDCTGGLMLCAAALAVLAGLVSQRNS